MTPAPVAIALRRKGEIECELARIEVFLSAYAEFSKRQKNWVRGRPKQYAERIEALLAQGAMNRRQIVEALEKDGEAVPANDKQRYVGTIIWRFLRSRIELTGDGYRLNG